MSTYKGSPIGVDRRKICEDFFKTPGYAVDAVRKYIPKDAIVWEPTYGMGDLVKGLENKIIKTDKYPKTDDTKAFDFLTDEPDFEYDLIYFNPPFCLKTEFLQRALSFNKPFLFVCPLDILATQTRSKLFYENKLSIINLSQRVNYTGKINNVMFHSVFVINDGLSKIHYEEIVIPKKIKVKVNND